MDIILRGDAKEIAALVVAIQERRPDTDPTPDQMARVVREALKKCGPVSIGKVDCHREGI